MSTSQRRQRGLARPNSRLQRKRRRASNTSTPMATQTETIELEENADEEVVDLTCESASDAVVVDLTHNDSVVFVGEVFPNPRAADRCRSVDQSAPGRPTVAGGKCLIIFPWPACHTMRQAGHGKNYQTFTGPRR
ncbi:hypothetical protein NDU88_001473 [Pleurodeles waltl]|uniref:Ring finger protein 4 n=1 Tax=Pleurodeles waltl TaxID=8319 RepID=A0AAV7WMJ6_PLEWA|nr:hypothetical protein NDU88_001473 [Pleurodeles waltl]